MANRSLTVANSNPSVLTRDWISIGICIAIALCAFGVVFYEEAKTAVFVWSSTDAYNHCFLILPTAVYLAWARRYLVAIVAPKPAPLLALLALPVGLAWFLADRLGIMEWRQLMALTLVQVMFAAVLGIRLWRAFAAPFLYLYFLIPFGEILIPPLQTFAVYFAKHGLDLLNIPNFVSGVTIEIPEGTFLVHQACSGLRFLIASVAFSVLYACLMFITWTRRVFFIILFIVVSVLGNDLRVLGTIVVAHLIGNAQAVEADHVLWGWLFYVVIGTVIVFIGLPFRQDPKTDSPLTRLRIGPITASSFVALGVVAVSVAVPAFAAHLFDEQALNSAHEPIEAPRIEGCTSVSLSPGLLAPPVPSASVGRSQTLAYECAGGSYIVTLYRFPPRANVRELFLSLHAVETPIGWDIIRQVNGVRTTNDSRSPTWRITEATTDTGRHIATATTIWINGKATPTEIDVRVEQALNTVRPAASPPVLAIVSGQNISIINKVLPETDGLLSGIVDGWSRRNL